MKRWIATGIVASVAASLLLFAWLNKTIMIVVDAQPQKITTFALTVGGALQAAHIPLGPTDQLTPSLETWISENTTITLDRAAAVQINTGGKLIDFVSTARRPVDLLTEAEIDLQAGDVLLSNGLPIDAQETLPQAGAYSFQLIRSKQVTLQADDTQMLASTAATLGQALWDAGIRLHVADRLNPSLHTLLVGDLEATLVSSQPITILTVGASLTLRSAAVTVGEALAEAGLAPQGLDYTVPPVNDPIPADGIVRLVRLREEVLIEQTALPFGSELQPVEDLELDQRQLVRQGEYGIQASRVRIRYEDGEEISRVVESEWQAQEPVDEIVGYGTKIVMHTLETPDGTINYYRALQFWATAYAPKYVGGSTRTASGKTLQKGMVGVDTSYIPFGTLMYIPGYGFAEAADTGNIVGRWIDLGYSDDDFEGWHQWVTVYFLWPPGYVPPIIPPPSSY